MTVEDPEFWLAVAQIIWIDALLSGDNAVVIALACRHLPPRQRLWGIVLGCAVAIGLRIVFTGAVTTVMALPYLKIAGGIALLWIAVKLMAPDPHGHPTAHIEPVDSLWHAIKLIVVADAVMSLDNVIAIAGAAKGHYGLIVFGLLVSIPIIMAGAAIIMRMLDRYPFLIWAGAALLGWIAGEIIATDPAVTAMMSADTARNLAIGSALFGVVLVLGVGSILRRVRRSQPDEA